MENCGTLRVSILHLKIRSEATLQLHSTNYTLNYGGSLMSSKAVLPKAPHKTRGGTRVPAKKNTAHSATALMPCPETVVLPMKQHIGAPCIPCVKAGNAVAVGDVVGRCDAYVGAPIHASVSGTVSKVIPVKLADGSVCDAVVIQSDGMLRRSKAIRPPMVTNKKELAAAVRESGLVGLGGAGFPASVKLDVPDDCKIDTLLVNCAECEPYITADHRAAVEDTKDILLGIITVMRCVGIRRTIIGVERNKPDAIKALEEAIHLSGASESARIGVLKLKAKYPQGDEKVLIKACTGRSLPQGKLPRDVGCIVMNISSVAFLGQYLRTGMPLVTKRVTVDGSAVKHPKNVIVPIGTAVKDVIAFCGGYKEKCGKLMYGGPMMGIALPNDTFPIIKQNNAVLAFSLEDSVLPKTTACIRCGRCAAHCPMHLMPAAVEAAVKTKDIASLKKHGVTACFECGSCAYNCPAHRQLVQVMRLGKALVTEAERFG